MKKAPAGAWKRTDVTAIDRVAFVFFAFFGLLYLATRDGEPIYGILGLVITGILWVLLRALSWAVKSPSSR